MATGVASTITTLVGANYLYDARRGEPVITIAALLLAVAIWLVGWAGRNMLIEIRSKDAMAAKTSSFFR
jgi:hypothetical protein